MANSSSTEKRRELIDVLLVSDNQSYIRDKYRKNALRNKKLTGNTTSAICSADQNGDGSGGDSAVTIKRTDGTTRTYGEGVITSDYYGVLSLDGRNGGDGPTYQSPVSGDSLWQDYLDDPPSEERDLYDPQCTLVNGSCAIPFGSPVSMFNNIKDCGSDEPLRFCMSSDDCPPSYPEHWTCETAKIVDNGSAIIPCDGSSVDLSASVPDGCFLVITGGSGSISKVNETINYPDGLLLTNNVVSIDADSFFPPSGSTYYWWKGSISRLDPTTTCTDSCTRLNPLYEFWKITPYTGSKYFCYCYINPEHTGTTYIGLVSRGWCGTYFYVDDCYDTDPEIDCLDSCKTTITEAGTEIECGYYIEYEVWCPDPNGEQVCYDPATGIGHVTTAEYPLTMTRSKNTDGTTYWGVNVEHYNTQEARSIGENLTINPLNPVVCDDSGNQYAIEETTDGGYMLISDTGILANDKYAKFSPTGFLEEIGDATFKDQYL